MREEIEDLQAEYEAKENTLGQAYTALNWVSSICGTLGIEKTVSSTLSATGLVAKSNPLTKAAGEGLDKTGSGLQKSVDQGMDFITSKCKYFQCDGQFYKDKIGTTGFGESLDEVSQKITNKDYVETMDPYSSLVNAIIMVCPQAILYHLSTSQAIDCNYVACLENAKSEITTIDQCQRERSYATCTNAVGHAVNALPFVDLARDAVDTVVDVASDPISLLSFAGLSLPCLLADVDATGFGGAACRVATGATGAIKIVNTLKQAYDNILKAQQGWGGDTCEAVFGLIENTNTYWGYDSVTGLELEKEITLTTLGDLSNNYPKKMTCNRYTGCTYTYKDDYDQEHTLTIFPGPNEGSDPIVYHNGKSSSNQRIKTYGSGDIDYKSGRMDAIQERLDLIEKVEGGSFSRDDYYKLGGEGEIDMNFLQSDKFQKIKSEVPNLESERDSLNKEIDTLEDNV
ncbi:MAG: hypothetical protein KAR08_12020, partial [Candidatus Heimdallarchaeota archaeon]|nr:hypothetical protein [Candidatus Heimdallarchaeota archaeon]